MSLLQRHEVLTLAIRDFGSEARIGNAYIPALLSEADAMPDAYTSDLISDAPKPWQAQALKSDFEALGLWPLNLDGVEIDERFFRVLRTQVRDGEVLLILREEC